MKGRRQAPEIKLRGESLDMTGKEVIKFIQDEGIQIVDLKFVDMPGLWQHFSISAREFEEDAFTEGCGFDGSSIRGFQAINESDMLLMPDPDTMFVDPFYRRPNAQPDLRCQGSRHGQTVFPRPAPHRAKRPRLI